MRKLHIKTSASRPLCAAHTGTRTGGLRLRLDSLGFPGKMFLLIFCALPLLLSAPAEAEPTAVSPTRAASSASAMEARLKLIEGDWLSPKGTLILEIQGQKINGCEITKYEDLVDRGNMGTTVFWILEEDGERMMQIDWRIMGDESDYLFLDGRLMLRRDDSL